MANDDAIKLIERLTGKDKQKTVAYVEELFQKAKRQRIEFERQWYTDLAFYGGKQYVQWHSVPNNRGFAHSKLYEPKAPPWRVRLVANKIKPITRTELAKVTKERPQAFVIPASADDNDLMAARAAEQIFEHLMRELRFNKVLRRALFWTITTGNGFIKDWWNPKAFDKNVVNQRMDQGSPTPPGNINIEPVTPFHLFVPDPEEQEIENQPFVIHTIVKDVSWVEEEYQVKVQGDIGGDDGSHSRFLTAIGVNQSAERDKVAVREAWIKPCKKYPQGAVITWANDKLLNAYGIDDDQPWPYQHQEYPFTHFSHVPTGRFYAESVIPDLIPLQKEYNRTRSQIVEAKNRMSKPQLAAPRGSIDANKVTSEPGLIIFYTPGFAPPTPIPLQNIPSYVIEEIDRCQRDMDDISSQHEVTKGRTPPGVTAATAIAYLQEEDDSKLSETIASIEEGVEKLGTHFLNHVQQFWDEERKIKVIGEEGAFESYMFSGADIEGNTDLKVEAGSATPRSKAAKQAFIMELFDRGAIPPDRMLKYLDMAETGRLYEEAQLDARQAQRENLRMAKNGEPVETNSWDNHEVHIMEHDNYRKRQQFEALPEELKLLFEQHVGMHRQLLVSAQGGMIAPGDQIPMQPGMPPDAAGAPEPGAGGPPDLTSLPASGGPQQPPENPSPRSL